MARPRDEAIWYFLAFCEDRALREVLWMLKGAARTEHDQVAFADNLVLHAKRPLAWIHASCSEGGALPDGSDGVLYQAARDLSDLATEYLGFEAAFAFGSSGFVHLELDGHLIRTSGPLRSDTRFEAYDHLVKRRATITDAAAAFLKDLVDSVQVSGNSFTYPLSPRTVRHGIDALGPLFDVRLRLPPHWRFPDFTVGQFADVARVLFVLGTMHFHARIAAAHLGCDGLGLAHALLMCTRDELVRRLTRYSGVPDPTVVAIVELLTYGARDQRTPDPALQPLLRLSDGRYLASPSMITSSSMERNLTVLLNRLPSEQLTYSNLSRAREYLSRDAITKRCSAQGFRFWNGSISGWDTSSDVDLAIISDKERACLLLELKDFIDPAEPREIMARSVEIARGIAQVRDRRLAAERSPSPLLSALGVDGGYVLTWAVASETSIGAVYVQTTDVPVVNARHLADRLTRSGLVSCSNWLQSRAYLPTEAVHYDTIPVRRAVGAWTLDWYGIRCRVDDFLQGS
jgi:hypothetical protein